MKTLEIRVDTNEVRLTGVDGDDRFDLARIPRVTGAAARFKGDDLEAEFNRLRDGGKPNPHLTGDEPTAPAEPEVYQPEVNASKNARALAEFEGVDLSKLDGSGPHDKVIVTDVEDFLKAAPQDSSTPTADEGADDPTGDTDDE